MEKEHIPSQYFPIYTKIKYREKKFNFKSTTRK